TQMDEAPQRKVVGAAVLDKALHFCWKTEAADQYLTAQALILNSSGCRCDTHRRRGHNQINSLSDEAQCFVIALYGSSVPVHNADQFDIAVSVRVAFEDFLKRLDPCVLVGGIGSSRQNGHGSAFFPQ